MQQIFATVGTKVIASQDLTMPALDKHVGNRLQSRRLELNLSEAAVAARIDIPIETYALFESGAQRIPASVLAELSQFLDLPVTHFFRGYPT
jgi:transcriptional regulator with XRE-family HTH domain